MTFLAHLRAPLVASLIAAVAAPVIAVTNGSGWAGSTYTVSNGGTGKWQDGTTDIPDATSPTYIMPLAREGHPLSWLRSDGVRSNIIEMWVKSDVAGFIDRFDARTGLTLAGSRVAKWTGVGGLLSASQTNSSQQPIYSATARNGLPGLLFDRGPRSNLKFDNPTALSAGKGGRMDVDMFLTPTMNTYLVALGVGVESQRWEFNLGGTSQLGIYTMATGDLNQSAPVNEDYVYTANVNVKAGATNSVQINALDTVTKVAGSNDAGDNSVAYIGARNPGFDYGLWHGVIQAIAFFSQARTADEIMRCRAYDAHSFGRPDLLSSNNPYKASPPRVQ